MTRHRRAKPLETRRASLSRSPVWVRMGLGAGLVFLVSGSLFFGSARSALAWGRMGHRASARFVESRLSQQARAIIRDLLEPGESLADAATWPDENSREIPGSAAWHFVNVRVSSPHYSPKDCRPQGCVVTKITEFRTILADRNAARAQRRMALRFFVHLVQDLHQPMHVADRNDRGGNNLQLRYGRYDNTNLHQVWDSGLLSQRFRREADLVHELETVANQPKSRDWVKGRIEDWADESLEVGRRAYLAVPGSSVMLRMGDAISRDYENENLPAAVERLARSGVRLASMLNEILKQE
jgi:nuclease S1